MVSKKVLTSLCLALVAAYFPNMAIAANPQADKYTDWRSDLKRYQVYQHYFSTTPENLVRALPQFNGRAYFLTNYNQETFRTITQVNIRFDTHTIVTTNTNISSSFSFNSYDFFNSSSSFGSLNNGDWINARANFLSDNFGLTSADALSTAMSERNFCQSNPADCASRMYTTHYQLDNIGPDTRTNSSVVVNNSNRSSSATNVNGNVRTTVTTNTRTTESTETFNESTTTGSRDTQTNATNADDTRVETVTQVDERTTVDEYSEETTTTDTETETRTDTEERQEIKRRARGSRHWDLQIAPMIFFNYNGERSITSLTPHYPSLAKFTIGEKGELLNSLSSTSERVVLDDRLNSSAKRSAPKIELGNASGPYLVKLRHDVSGGVGAVLQFVQVNAQGIEAYMVPFVGVAPVASHSATSERNVKTLQEAQKARSLKMPLNAQELSSWATLDRLSYTSSGGLMFIGGLSMPGLSIGTSYIANGTWNTEVQKVDAHKVYVKVGRGSMKSLTAYVSPAVITALSKSNFSGLNQAFSYMFDLRDPKAEVAYQQLIKGNAVVAQKLAVQKNVKSVIRVESSHVASGGTVRSLRIGIPGINFRSTTGTIQSAEMSDYYPDNTQIEANYGIYLKEKNSRFLTFNANTTYGFYSSAFKSQAAKAQAETGTFGMVGWSFKSSDADENSLQKAIQRLVLLTGMSNELLVDIEGGNRNKGFANVEFSLKLDQLATNTLLGLTQSQASLQQVARISSSFVHSVFEKGEQTSDGQKLLNDLIEAYSPATRPSPFSKGRGHKTLSRSERLKIARSKIEKETKNASSEMIRALSNMKAAQARGDRQTFSKEYAAFGKAMLTNQFMFQTAFNIVKGRGATARYTISGESLKFYDLSFDWKPLVR